MDINTRVLDKDHILNGKYRIERVLGEGGFGITYLAQDIMMKERVAIKEYFPTTLATRDTTANRTGELTIITGENSVSFAKGLKRFEDEAAKLAKFQREEGIVSVKNFFHENGTGYMVMEYIDGITLKEYLFQNGGYLSCEKTLAMMKPVMQSLAIVHQSGIIHRDISPDNIMVTGEGKMKLIDFGAARFVSNEDEKSLTVLLKEGYAPPEQYQTNGDQGTWTDVYALCATMYRMISGQVPTESVAQVMQGDSLVTLKHCADVSENISKAISKGMALPIINRTQTIEELMKSFNRKTLIHSWTGIAILGFAIFLCVGIVSFCIAKNSAEKATEAARYDVIDAEMEEDKTENEVKKTEEEISQTLDETTESVVTNTVPSPTEQELLDIFAKNTTGNIRDYIYEDFDDDGQYEMFVIISNNKWDYEDVSLEDGINDSNYGAPFSVGLVTGNGYEIVDYIQSDSSVNSGDRTRILYQGIELVRFGREKHLLVHTEEARAINYVISCCNIYGLSDGEPKKLAGFTWSDVISDGENIYIGEMSDDGAFRGGTGYFSYIYYPLIYLNGEYSEIASVEIDASMLQEIENWKSVEAILDSKISTLEEDNQWRTPDCWPTDYRIINVLYNDVGNIYINYECDVQYPEDAYYYEEMMNNPYEDFKVNVCAELALSGKRVVSCSLLGGYKELSCTGAENLVVSDVSNIWKNNIVEEAVEEKQNEEEVTEVSEEVSVSLSEEELLALIKSESSLEVVELPEYHYTEYSVEDTVNKIYDDFNGDGVNEMFALMRSTRQEWVTVIASTELREKPDENSTVVEICSEGQSFVRYNSSDNGWSYVENYGAKGYVKSEDIKFDSWDDRIDIHCFELWFSNGEITQKIDVTMKDLKKEKARWDPTLLGINTIQFGKEKHLVLLCSNYAAQTEPLMAETFRFDGENVEGIATANENYYISSGIDGKACVKDLNNFLCFGKMNLSDSEWAKVINVDESSYNDTFSCKYTTCDIYFIEGKYKEYIASELSVDELYRYGDYKAAIEEAEKILYNMDYSEVSFSLWSDKPVNLLKSSVFVSENDKLYINYEVHTEPDASLEEIAAMGAEGAVYNVNAVFTIENNKLTFLTINPGKKESIAGILQE